MLLSAHRFSDGSILEGRLAFLTDQPGLSVASYAIKAAPESPREKADIPRVDVDQPSLRIKTPHIHATLNPDGGIATLTDAKSGEPLFAPGKRSGFFAGKIDGAERESHGKWTLETAGADAPWVTARENGFIGAIPYTLALTFHADTPRMDGRVQFHIQGQKIGRVSDVVRDGVSGFVHEDKLRLKLFPNVDAAAVGVRDLPFAVSETTAKYIEGIYWMALADRDRGVAFFNRGAMGAVREADGGFSLPLTFAMNYIWGTRMLSGDFSYDFAIYPFTGEWRQADLHRQAIAYNFPAVFTSGPPGAGQLGAEVQPIEIASDRVLLSALYSEGGKILARLYECEGRDQNATLTRRDRPALLKATDLLGRGDEAVKNPIAFHPWQFRTLRIESP